MLDNLPLDQDFLHVVIKGLFKVGSSDKRSYKDEATVVNVLVHQLIEFIGTQFIDLHHMAWQLALTFTLVI